MEPTEPGATAVRRLPMFPLSTVLFPGELLPLHVFEPRYRALVADCLEHEPHEFGVVLIARGSEVGGGDVRTDTGTVARIEALSRSHDGRYALLAQGTSRLRVEEWLEDDPYPQANVSPLEDAAAGDRVAFDAAFDAARTAVWRVEALLSEMSADEQSGGRRTPDFDTGQHRDDAAGGDESWALCRRLPLGPLDRQRLLSAGDPVERLSLLAELAGDTAEDIYRLLGQA